MPGSFCPAGSPHSSSRAGPMSIAASITSGSMPGGGESPGRLAEERRTLRGVRV